MAHRQQQLSLALAAKAVALAREFDRQASDRWLLYQALSLWIQAAAVVSPPSPDALREALAELAALEDPGWPAQRLTRGLEAMCWARVALGGPDQPAEQLTLTRRLVEGFEAEGAHGAPAMMMLIDAELFCGRTQTAARLGERLLEQLAATRDEFSRMLVRINLDLALLALDDTVRARPVLQAVWPAARQFDLCALCSDHPPLLACLEGRPNARRGLRATRMRRTPRAASSVSQRGGCPRAVPHVGSRRVGRRDVRAFAG